LTQSSVAFSADGESWFLVNASPDLRSQIEAFPGLHPRGPSLRHSPIEAVLLTNADLDHVLGLFLLREADSIHLHTTCAVRETLSKGLRLDEALASYCAVIWHETMPGHDFAPLLTRSGQASGLSWSAIALAGSPPLYSPEGSGEGVQSIACLIRDERTGGILLVAPDVEEVTPALLSALHEADGVLFDGTFWSDDELIRIKGSPRSALDMGHLPLQSHSLKTLCGPPARHKILLHINNTNPVLRPGSPERAEVEAAGVTIGHDGLEFEL
jgi:pyrroloquinoline quinone biosynthesis protein B